MICFGWVLWHINHRRLFNAKPSSYVYIKYIGFGWFGFYGISTIVGYLMPNHLYRYIWFVNTFRRSHSYTSLSSVLHTVKWFQVLLHDSHNLTSVICLHTVCSIWPIDRTLSGVTTPDQSELGNNGSEGVIHIPQISKAGAVPLDYLIAYPRHSMEGRSYPSAEKQLVYFSATADWAYPILEYHRMF